MLQLSQPTRNFLKTINLTALVGAFGASDLFAFLLFLGLAVVLLLVASERLLRSAPDDPSPAR